MTAVWAHRGASAAAPENTLPAFQAAATLGADGVELDVQRTRDGQLVVCHEETIDRTSNGVGNLADYTLSQLKEFDFSAGHPEFTNVAIPTLAEVFDVLGPTGLMINIELKNSVVPYEGMEAQVLALVHAAGWDDKVFYSSFNHRSMRRLAERDYPVGLLYDSVLWRAAKYAAELGASALHPSGRAVRVNPGVVRAAHKRGLSVNVWTIDKPAQIQALLDLEVDAIITNVPDVALGVRDA
ncbi:Glycerophosphoryl diester phosphodiesterase family protein [Propionibacterium freudenreichii]|nr:Glycerophosphoryl diester phosphodiesterase family protein [Propionibacterium freudenreichii]SCQ81776.1 Glycerophosphoryl diester phosphodiesterase family protein [Propionibacterium freudenreichii]